ncbi:hypothetical protein H5410_055368, partial [Solanum commersonii]
VHKFLSFRGWISKLISRLVFKVDFAPGFQSNLCDCRFLKFKTCLFTFSFTIIYVVKRVAHYNMNDFLVDLMLYYGGKWITKSLLVYDKKYVATRRDTSAAVLDYDKTVKEYIKNLGFVLVKQILVKETSGKFYLLEVS